MYAHCYWGAFASCPSQQKELRIHVGIFHMYINVYTYKYVYTHNTCT